MALIKCTGCGHVVSDKAIECPHCGHPILQENSNICKECGETIPENTSVCPNCGCPIENVEAVQEEVYYDEEPEKKKWWIWALVIVLLCIGGGYYAYAKHVKGENEKDAIVELTPEFIKSIEKYDILSIFSEGYAAVRREGKWGYINTKGEEVIPTKFEVFCAGRFSEGLAFVANNKEENSFSIIDKNGQILFQGKDYDYDGIGDFNDSSIPRCENLPYFIEGKIYIPIMNNKFQVYDTKGTKLEVVDSKIGDSVYRKHGGAKHIVFYDYISVSENVDAGITKCGLKDSIGNVLISAKYDDIGNVPWFDIKVDKEFQHIACVSNGVILAVLDELKEDYYTSFDGVNKVRHYGYVDLKGNDTFSEQLKSLCQKAEQKAIQKFIEVEQNYTQEIEEANMQHDWLQGRWVGTDSGSGYPIEVIIDGDNLIEKINGQVCYNGSYQFNGDFIVYNDGNNFWPVDNERQVLTYDGSPMRKENRNSSSSSTSSNSSYNNSSSSSNEFAKYDEKISQYYPIMEEAYQQFMRDVRSGGYTTITPPNSFYELSNACSSVGAAANEARKICIKKGDTAGEQKYERIWEREKRLYDSAYNILGNLH